FLAEKIWIINESVSYFNKSDAPTKVARLLRRYAPRNDEFKNRTVQRSYAVRCIKSLIFVLKSSMII
ncbi:MAG: hypothetical protein Q8R83_09765, partial [Legionellaceae bacterium]|nr:hypothetical protein [Legionellaceae bacterium]